MHPKSLGLFSLSFSLCRSLSAQFPLSAGLHPKMNVSTQNATSLTDNLASSDGRKDSPPAFLDLADSVRQHTPPHCLLAYVNRLLFPGSQVRHNIT